MDKDKRIENLENAVRRAHLSLTWCNTDQQIPAAIYHLEQVLPQAIESTEQAQAV